MFGFALAPLLVGAGVGALGGLLSGKDPLKGALMGGATSGLLGAVTPAIGAGGVGAGAASATSAATNAGFNAAASGLAPDLARQAAFEASMGLPSSALISAGAPIGTAFPLGASSGMIQGASGNLINPDYYSNVLGNQVYTGGEGVFSNAIDQFTPSMDELGKYFDIRDIGNTALQSLGGEQQRMPTPQSGRITEGRAPQGNDVMALLQTMKLPDRRRITLL
jgi:hypothetical protein